MRKLNALLFVLFTLFFASTVRGQSGVNEYQIDGVSNNANTGRSNVAYVPPAESTQEFKVQTNLYDAQYGRTGGGVVNLSIKPGRHAVHTADKGVSPAAYHPHF